MRPALAVAWLLPSLAVAAPWPAEDAPLTNVAPPPAPKKFRPIRVAIDPGHGAPGNRGNQGVLCAYEADHMAVVAAALAGFLRDSGRFQVTVLREGDATPRYPDRVRQAAAARAEVIVSLHSDARGDAKWWSPAEGVSCLRNDAEPGVSVLLSDEGPPRLVQRRLRLARTLVDSLVDAGFTAYDGADYSSLYTPDPTRGVFVDARPKPQRVYMLRQRVVPAVIIETHHALDFEESRRWREPRTFQAFGAAVAAALWVVLRSPDPG